jgi:hypothetical protein
VAAEAADKSTPEHIDSTRGTNATIITLYEVEVSDVFVGYEHRCITARHGQNGVCESKMDKPSSADHSSLIRPDMQNTPDGRQAGPKALIDPDNDAESFSIPHGTDYPVFHSF